MGKKVRIMSLTSILFCFAMQSLACGVTASRQWTVVRVELPANDVPFPPGVGEDIASSQCLICHSAGMVLTQPPLKKDEWRAEIMKMRTAYGAPIPDEQVDGLSEYLRNINGRQ